jgi:multiple sugar transport system permease protein
VSTRGWVLARKPLPRAGRPAPGAARARAGIPARAPRRRGNTSDRAGYVFLIPWFAGLALFTLGPMLFSLYLSFTNYSLLQSPQWAGLANFRRMFSSDPRYLDSVIVTVKYVAVSVPAKLVIALLIAMLLNRQRRGAGLYRSVFYVPSLLGASVSVALVWRSLFGPAGAADKVLSLAGIHGTAWIDDPRWALWTLVVLAAWQFGAPMVIFLAGLKQIPGELYDAAAVDGAHWWGRFWRITIPMLSPVIFFNLVLELVGAFQAFTPAYIISGGTGGPADSTLFYTLYLYEKGFSDFQFGYASAMAWIMLAAVGLCTALLFRLARLWVFYADTGDR